MENIRIPWKKDDFGHDIFARVAWKHDVDDPNASTHGRPIALIFHGGGLIVGSSEIVPSPQTTWLCAHGFVVIIPNYRLAPQISARESFADALEAYTWATTKLPSVPGAAAPHNIPALDPTRVVAMGHSIGGTLALHLAAQKGLRGVTALYPSLFLSDRSTSAHRPSTAPPMDMARDYTPTEAEWAEISPAPPGEQISEAPLGMPPPAAMGGALEGFVVPARSRWQLDALKNGRWLEVVQPDGNLEVMDPMARLGKESGEGKWAPVMIVAGMEDRVPGSEPGLQKRAVEEMGRAGVEVACEWVEGAGHMFDLKPTVGTSDLGREWQGVVKGLEWLRSRV